MATEAACTIELANEIDEIQRMIAAIEEFGERHAVPEAVVGHFVLSLDELVTNVISYGYPDRSSRIILVSLRLDAQERLIAELIDDGVPYDPLQTPPPDLDADLDDRPIGGLGVHIVKTLMDSVEYRRDGDRNCVTLTKALTRTRSDA